jgi:autotransporter strand-loop-strand O-heptosyltransferase
MNTIYYSEFVITLSSGLGWLAFAMNKKTVLLANFTEDWHEWSTNCIRITNKNTCYGCWNNKNFRFSTSDWNWCPIFKDTNRQWECHTSISGKTIIKKIKELL